MRSPRPLPRHTPVSAAALSLPAAVAALAVIAFLFQRYQTFAARNSVVDAAQAYASLAAPEQVASLKDLRRSKIAYALSLITTLEAQANASSGSAPISIADLRILRGALRSTDIATAPL